MAHARDQDHVVLRPRTLPKNARIAFWACVVLAVAMILVGWVFTMKNVIERGFVDAQQTFQSATAAMTEIRKESAASNMQVSQSGQAIGNVIVPFLNTAIEEKQAMDTVAEIMVENMNAYAEQEEPTTTDGSVE